MTEEMQKRTIRTLTLRIIPILLVGYLIAYVDRINIGFAATALKHDLGLSNTVFGFGAGLFFVGYFFFEVPSNLLLEKIGPRVWLARIMISWGILSAGMVFVRGEYSFYALRFLIGIAEAGFFPGVLFIIATWFPQNYQTRLMGLFSAGIPLSSVIGAPLSGALLGLNGVMGLPGWWWMFVLEGVPAVLLGVALYLLLPDRPRNARWLSAEQKDWLEDALAASPWRHQPSRLRDTLKSFYDPRVLALALCMFCNIAASIGLAVFLPQIVASMGVSRMATGWITAIPAAFGVLGLYGLGWLSDRTGNRRLMLLVSIGISFVGLLLAARFGAGGASAIGIVALSFGALGIFGLKAPFWALVPTVVAGPAMAGGIAWINSIGNLGGAFGPGIIGWLSDVFGGYEAGIYALAAAQLVAGLLVGLLLRPQADARP